MYLERRRYYISLVIISFCLACKTVVALEIQSDVGVNVRYTDNANLTQDNEVSDQITTAYVGASIAKNEGALTYDVMTSIKEQNYAQDTFADQSYFNLAASADWKMIPDRFNWSLTDAYRQRTIDPLDSNTPDNRQDSNVFKFGANIIFPASARQNFSLNPLFSQYYYEQSPTDNKQHSITARWNYQMFRLTSVGINLGARKINYSEQEQAINDSTFSTLSIVLNGQRVRSNFTISLGATNVKKDTGKDSSGFSGSLNFNTEISSRSTFKTLLSTDITDTSSAIGNPDDVQLSSDIVRNSVINLAYLRDDEELRSNIWAVYRKVTYINSSVSDRMVRSFGVKLDYPVTQLLSSGVYVNFNRTTLLDDSSFQDKSNIGGNIKYRFTAKLHSAFDIRYRTKDSADSLQNYNEFSVFASLVYGFGGVSRPTGTGTGTGTGIGTGGGF